MIIFSLILSILIILSLIKLKIIQPTNFSNFILYLVGFILFIGSLTLFFIDYFKFYNDALGHVQGDDCLKRIAFMLNSSTSSQQDVLVARYGGEEFAIVLPACQPAYGKNVADRIREMVANEPFAISPSQSLPMTVSIGGAYALQWIRSTSELWIERADQQLYHAKKLGRNRVCIEPQPDSTVTAEEKELLFSGLVAPGSAYPETTSIFQVTSSESD